MGQATEARKRWAEYWRQAWEEKPVTRRFPLYRALPALLVAFAQFLISRKQQQHPQSWGQVLTFAVVTIIVYMILYAGEICWHFVSMAPVRLDEKRQGESEQ